MAKSTDLYPTSRDARIAMAANWVAYLTAARQTAWGIPQEQFTAPAGLQDAAAAVLRKTRDDAQRTPVVTAQCRAAFKALEARMRFFKSHYFLMPPLTLDDYHALGLQERAAGSDIPAPNAEPAADIGYPDPHVIDIFNLRPGRPTPPTPAATTASPTGWVSWAAPRRTTSTPRRLPIWALRCLSTGLPASAGSVSTFRATAGRPSASA